MLALGTHGAWARGNYIKKKSPFFFFLDALEAENRVKKRSTGIIFILLSVGYPKIENAVIFTVLKPILASNPQNIVSASPPNSHYYVP